MSSAITIQAPAMKQGNRRLKPETERLGYKYCPECQQSRVLTLFYKNDAWCRMCRKKYNDEHYTPLPPVDKYERRKIQRKIQEEEAIAEENNVRQKIARMQVYIATALANPDAVMVTKKQQRRQQLVEQDGYWTWQ